MSVSRDEVKHIADLARLQFTDKETEKLATEINTILDYMKTLDEVDTDDVAPLQHVSDFGFHPREDETKEPLDHDDALKNASDADSDYFRVPRVIE